MSLNTFTRSSLRSILGGVFLGALLLACFPYTVSAETDARWYNKTEWTFSWGDRVLASAVAVDIAPETGTEPFTVFNPPVASVTFSDGELREGLQYFVLQFKEDGEWGDIFEQELRIDVTPPVVHIRVEYDEVPYLFVEAEDALSGIEKYTVIVSGEEYTLQPADSVTGYALPELPQGNHEIVVTAYDNAGNATALRKMVTVGQPLSFGSMVQNIRAYLVEHSAEVNTVVIVFLSLMAVFGISFGVIEHRAHAKVKAETRREILSMQNNIAKVFSTLRREVRMLTTMTTKKSRVTKKEKEAVAKVTKALSESESVIEHT